MLGSCVWADASLDISVFTSRVSGGWTHIGQAHAISSMDRARARARAAAGEDAKFESVKKSKLQRCQRLKLFKDSTNQKKEENINTYKMKNFEDPELKCKLLGATADIFFVHCFHQSRTQLRRRFKLFIFRMQSVKIAATTS